MYTDLIQGMVDTNTMTVLSGKTVLDKPTMHTKMLHNVQFIKNIHNSMTLPIKLIYATKTNHLFSTTTQASIRVKRRLKKRLYVCMCAYMCVCVCVCVGACVHACVCASMCVCKGACMCVYVHVFGQVYVRAHAHVCIIVCLSKCL